MSNPDTSTPPVRYYRKIFKITAEDSPNVRYARAQIACGLRPTGEMIVPGVMPWHEYMKRRTTWDKISQCVGLDAEFYEGAEILMYPPQWLGLSDQLARDLLAKMPVRRAEGIGIDPAEGGDKTAMSAVDRYGLIELVSKKTPNTAVIVREAIAFMIKHGCPPHKVAIDRGGGGKQHADAMRELGYPIRTVAFGETVVPNPKRGMTILEDKIEQREERYQYVNRRAQMYGDLRMLMDPEDTMTVLGSDGQPLYSSPGDWELSGKSKNRQVKNVFAIPFFRYPELRAQLAPIPLMYDPEGRGKLLPKNKRNPDSDEMTLTQLIGHSPDEADSLVLAIHAMLHKDRQTIAGGIR